MEALKRPEADAEAEDRSVRAVVEQMLANIRNRGEDSVREIAEKLDNWTGDFVLTDAKKQTLIDSVSESEKADLRFAHAQVKRKIVSAEKFHPHLLNRAQHYAQGVNQVCEESRWRWTGEDHVGCLVFGRLVVAIFGAVVRVR